MNKTWKKMLALALTLCTVLGLMVPMAGAADASEYELPEIGPVTYLGEPMKRDKPSLGYFLEMITYGNKQYVLALAKGGTLYVFSLTDYLNGEENVYGNYIYDSQPLTVDSPNYIVVDSKNIAYISDGKGITVYDISTKTAAKKISLPKEASALTVDGDDNLYVAGDGGYVYKVKNNNGTYSINWTADFSADLTRMSGIVYADGYVYACGTDGDATYFYKLDPADGSLEKEPLKDTRISSSPIYLSYADGKLFGGRTTSCSYMAIVDAATMTPTTITMKLSANGEAITENTKSSENLSIIGAVSAERDGYVYFFVSSSVTYANGGHGGFYRYSTTDHEAVRIGTRTARGFRFRNSYVTIENPVSGRTGTFLVNAYNGGIFFDRIEGNLSTPSLTNLWKGAAGTIDPTRHVGTGVSGTGPAVYIGGFRTPYVAGYDPTAQEPMDNQVFSHGHSQLDATIVYDNKLYGGCYSGGFVFEYVPSNGSFRNLIPTETVGDETHSILNTQYGQLRIHALAAGDNKIFFSTVPDEGKLGGVIGWYDLTAEKLTVKKLADLVPAEGCTNELGDQILISLVYDNGLLYGTSSIYGGGGGVTLTAEEGLLMVYDVNNEKLLGNFSVRSEGNDNSDMSFGSVVPKYINGIARDPANGKMWGVVDETIFSFSYDRTGNTMTVTEEVAGRKSVYTASGNPNWFPHPILFDGAGHVIVDTDSICRYTLDGNNKLTQKTSLGIASRSYALGTDGNLYVINSGHTELWRVSLNPHSIVEDMITCAATGQNGITPTEAQAAYNALEDEDKSKVNASILRVLQNLQGAECQVENGDAISYTTVAAATAAAGANTAISLLADYSGDIAVNGGATLDLAGYTVTGSVIVTDGIVKDSAGTGGIVLADSNDQISLEGATALPQIPLLDGDTYRFYSWDAKNLTSTKETDQVKFWFDLVFEDTEAYTLLSGNAQTHLDVHAWLYVDGTKQDASVVFDDAVKGWAAENHTGTDDYALYVGVTNIPKTVYDISVQPYIDIFGKRITLDKMDRDVAFIRAELKYDIYPTN